MVENQWALADGRTYKCDLLGIRRDHEHPPPRISTWLFRQDFSAQQMGLIRSPPGYNATSVIISRLFRISLIVLLPQAKRRYGLIEGARIGESLDHSSGKNATGKRLGSHSGGASPFSVTLTTYGVSDSTSYRPQRHSARQQDFLAAPHLPSRC